MSVNQLVAYKVFVCFASAVILLIISQSMVTEIGILLSFATGGVSFGLYCLLDK